MRLISQLLLVCMFLANCQTAPEKQKVVPKEERLPTLNFSLVEQETTIALTVHQLFKDSDLEASYTLSRMDASEKNRIRIPVQRVVCLSTTHIGYIDALGHAASIVGASNTDLIYSETLQQKAKVGQLVEVGKGSIDYEKIIQLQPDVVFGYGIDANSIRELERLEAMGIPVVVVSEFTEATPLRKAAWLRFFATFYDELPRADSMLQEIEQAYEKVSAQLAAIDQRPQVFSALPWKGTWYVPGGASFQAHYFNKAGAKYLWDDNQDMVSIPMDFEVVYEQAAAADFWLHPGNLTKLEELEAMDERYTHFSAYQKGQVFNHNRRQNANGGNDYWESASVRPDLVLKDLAAIFHPDLFPEHQLFYYQKLKD